MAEIPANLPWIPSFNTWLDAMHSGAALGLQRRNQDIQAQEAAARLQQQHQQMLQTVEEQRQKARLGWAQLGMDREINLARLNQAAATQQASLALREGQLESLTNYRQLEAGNAAARLEESRRHGAESSFIAAQNLELRRQMAEGTETRASARLKEMSDDKARTDQRLRTQFQIQALQKEQAADPFGFMLGAPQPKDPAKLAAWKRVNDRAKQIDALTGELRSGAGGVSGSEGQSSIGGGGGGSIDFVRDPKTGKLVPQGTRTAGSSLAAPPADPSVPTGITWGANPTPGMWGITPPSPAASFLTGASSQPTQPTQPTTLDTLPPNAQLTPGWLDQVRAGYTNAPQ